MCSTSRRPDACRAALSSPAGGAADQRGESGRALKQQDEQLRGPPGHAGESSATRPGLTSWCTPALRPRAARSPGTPPSSCTSSTGPRPRREGLLLAHRRQARRRDDPGRQHRPPVELHGGLRVTTGGGVTPPLPAGRGSFGLRRGHGPAGSHCRARVLLCVVGGIRGAGVPRSTLAWSGPRLWWDRGWRGHSLGEREPACCRSGGPWSGDHRFGDVLAVGAGGV